jgi:outer membrane protein
MLALVMAVGATSTNAQTLKLGYINSLELLSLMPEIQPADAELEKYANQLDGLFSGMMQEYQNKLVDYEKNQPNWTPDTEELKIKELQDLEKRIQEFQNSSQEKLGKKREELYAPILEKADKAIKEVATEEGYTYIFDASTGSLLFADESEDILDKVRAKLGI